MWKGSYGKEPFDLRLTILRMIRTLPILVVTIIIGTILLGGGYYVKKVVFRPEKTYGATATYKIEFASETWAQYGTYINETTWNTWVHTDEFLAAVEAHMSENGNQLLDRQALSAALSAKLASDLRMPSTIVVTTSQELTAAITKAVEATMEQEFAQGVSDDIASIRVIDAGKSQEIPLDVRVSRAFLLGFAVACLFVIAGFLIWELGDDGIHLPTTLKNRYGIPCLGTVHSKECLANMQYLLMDKKQVAICPTNDGIDPMEVAKALEGLWTDKEKTQFTKMPAPILCPESAAFLREADAVVLVVPAGSGVGKGLEHALDFLGQQDVAVTATLLWNADEALIKSYYMFGK